MKKIFNLNVLEKVLSKKKLQGKKIVLCHGVFDLLHVGHIKHFNQAKTLGDILVVTITKDKYVNKGPGRPAFSQNLRLEVLEALKMIDFLAINEWSTSINTIKKLKPHIYFKGPDYKNHKNDITGNIVKELNAIKSVGGKIVYGDKESFSSSNLLNNFLDTKTIEQKLIINKLKKKYSFANILKLVENLKNKKILLIGEAIIDEYVFSEALGKSGKESILTFREERNEKYLGGILAIANHSLSFSNKVSAFTYLGEKDSEESFILKNVSKRINFQYIRKKNSPTIIKRRYLDKINGNKIFGIYNLNDDAMDKVQTKTIKKKITSLIKSHDIVIVADYGHGFLGPEISKLICKKSKYLSINAQINSSNVGYHDIRKFKNFNNLIINAKELTQTLRQRNGKLEQLAKSFKNEVKAENIAVTMGKKGALLINRKDKIFECPAFANKIIDKVGSGDAFLTLFSMFMYISKDEELSAFISSLGAAQSVETMGNSFPVNKTKLLKTIEYVFK